MLRPLAQGLRPLRLQGLAQQLAAGQPRPLRPALGALPRAGPRLGAVGQSLPGSGFCFGPALPRHALRTLSTAPAKEEAVTETEKVPSPVEDVTEATASAASTTEKAAEAPRDGSEYPDAPPVHPLILEVVRGMGQVVFCESLVSGACISAALLIGDFQLGSLALVGCTSATATARLLRVDQGAITSGLLGYNGALVGCAFSVFLLQTPLGLKAVATVLGGAASALLASRLGKLTAPVPQWTWAFNATALATIACLRPFASAGPPNPTMAFAAMDWSDWIAGFLNGISQIFVVSNPISGMLILLGIALYSPWAAAAALLGSVLGAGAAFVYGADAEEVEDGIWGFNPALTALAVSIFFVPLGRPFQALVCGGALATVAAFIGLKAAVWSTFQSPCMTLPFCAVASGCFLLGGRVPGLVRARAPHSPEVNMQAYRAAGAS